MHKKSLEDRQAEMRVRQLAERRKLDRRCKVDLARVEQLAAMNLSITQIANEVGCSAAALYTLHRGVIEVGRLRGGTIVKRVIYALAKDGDMKALAHLHRALNHEELMPPKEIQVSTPQPTTAELIAETEAALERYNVDQQWHEFTRSEDILEERRLMRSKCKPEDRPLPLGVTRVYPLLL